MEIIDHVAGNGVPVNLRMYKALETSDIRFEFVQAFTRADPEDRIPAFHNRSNMIIADRGCIRRVGLVGSECIGLRIESVKAPGRGAHPKTPAAILINGGNVPSTDAFLLRRAVHIMFKGIACAIEQIEGAGCADPEPIVLI